MAYFVQGLQNSQRVNMTPQLRWSISHLYGLFHTYMVSLRNPARAAKHRLCKLSKTCHQLEKNSERGGFGHLWGQLKTSRQCPSEKHKRGVSDSFFVTRNGAEFFFSSRIIEYTVRCVKTDPPQANKQTHPPQPFWIGQNF